jgi:hypothetical protein
MRIAFKKQFKNKPETRIYLTANSGLSIEVCRYCYGLESRKSSDGIDHANNYRRAFLIDYDVKKDINTTLKVLSTAVKVCQYLVLKGYTHEWTQD